MTKIQDHQNALRSIVSFLSDSPLSASCWCDEIIDLNETKRRELYPVSWWQEMISWSEQKLWAFDAFELPLNDEQIKNDSLREWLQMAGQLTSIEKADFKEVKKLPSWAFQKVGGKKQHEINRLVGYLQMQHSSLDFEQLQKRGVTDLAGGVGHLARTLAHYYSIPTTSLDYDRYFQQLGKQRAAKHPLPSEAAELSFISCDLSQQLSGPALESFKNSHLTIGLHTCGPLAITHLQEALCYQKNLINFGCCYHKMDHTSDVGLSKAAKQYPLKWSPYALTLASRGHNHLSFATYLHKKRVKFFRYGLDLYLKEVLQIPTTVYVGDSYKRMYRGKFSEYALPKIKEHLSLTCNPSADELDRFFAETQVQKRLQEMFIQNLIRWRIGPLLEHYILRDRACYLQEQGPIVEMKSLFDEKISSRHIFLKSFCH